MYAAGSWGWDAKAVHYNEHNLTLSIGSDIVFSLVAKNKVYSLKVLPQIADHNAVLFETKFSIPVSQFSSRLLWDYSKADWAGLQVHFSSLDWSWIDDLEPNDAAVRITDIILDSAHKFIPSNSKGTFKSTHPWINSRCVQLVQAKVEAEGTPLYRETAELCSRGLLEEYFKYIERTRTLLKSLPSGSKLYWKVSKRLLMRPESCSTLPTLRDNDGWARTSQEKSNVLANTFSGKWILPPVAHNEYSDIFVANDHASSSQSGFLLLRTRVLKRLLKKLAVDSATGPDLISSRLLKFCADSLALPFCKLARCIVRHGIWPASWCFHWICALHKKKSPSDPNNYRGLQLTSQLSKVMERFIGLLFQPFLERSLAFGENQFAYCKGKGSRDAILFLILNWLLALAAGNKIAVYCSDVSGAFDKVSSSRLLEKLSIHGVHADILKVLRSWLGERKANVVVGGVNSDSISMRCDTIRPFEQKVRPT